MDTDQLHQKVLYPVTRVRAGSAGGSGVLIYSEPDPKQDGKFINMVLTCEHVIDGLIKVEKKWDAVIKQERQQEIIDEATVEVFDYDGSRIVSSNATRANVVAYSKEHDVAVLKLHNTRKMDTVATLYPKDKIDDLRIGDGVWVCGCSLLHDPFPSPGTLTYLREVIEQKTYLMANAPSVFGNSGGGLFYQDGSLLGLSSRITLTNVGGFGGLDIMTWMGFSTHPDRIYEFIDDQELLFLYDGSDDYYSAMDRRKKRADEALRHLVLGQDAPIVPEDGTSKDG